MHRPCRVSDGQVLFAVAVAALLLAIPNALRAQVPDDFSGFRVQGRHLYDVLGSKVILVGVNKMVIYTDRDGLPSFPEIAKTGANAVRIVWLTEGSPEELDTVITNAINNKLIPIVDCHDSTGKWDVMPTCVDYWVRPDVASVLRKHERYVLVNIANEAGAGLVPSLEFRTAYELAIRRIRAAALHVPLIIDAQGWGQQINDLQASGPYLVQADPDHNLLFSIHMWWPSASRASVVQHVTDEIAESVAMGLPLIIGEFANKGPGCTCCISYDTIIEQAHLSEVGYLAWSWGPGNQDCAEMDMTEDGTFNTLHGWGLEVAVTSTHSIQAIAVRPDWIIAMTPVPLSTPVPTPTHLPPPEGLLSLDRPVKVSSVEGAGLEGSNAVDGRLGTRWSSVFTDPQTLTVDLGTVQPIARIVLQWEAAYGREYKLHVSEDGEAWADIIHVTDGDGGEDDHIVATAGRYVRLTGLKRGTQWGYSLYEMWVFDRADVALPAPGDPLDGEGGAPVPTGVDERPDLAISEITWAPDPVRPGDAVTFSAVVENRGTTANPPRAIRCDFQISNQTVAWGEFNRIITPGTSTICTANTTWGPVDAGEFIVLGWVDAEDPQPYGRVDESDETNNMATASNLVRELTPTPSINSTLLPGATPTPEPQATPSRPADPTPTDPQPGPIRDSVWVLIALAIAVIGAALLVLRSHRH
ncbi:MAG: discoidin domain-containing protein [Anaerolineae bacterium]|nr:discoidin domain-containing protein [Anaerolineae bacterium]